MCCSGLEKTDARGMNTRVRLRLEEAIWRCCSGPEKTDALGIHERVRRRPGEAIWRCCSGPEQTDALGMKARICRAILCSGSRQTEAYSGVVSWIMYSTMLSSIIVPHLLAREGQ